MPKEKLGLNESSALLLQLSIEAGITSPKELANILGNADVETAGFSTMHERFNYKTSGRLIATVKSASRRFDRDQIDQAVKSRDPEQIATILYEGRSDLGNTRVGDGWRFHGRGYFQYTGRENYARWGRQFGVDLLDNPDQAAEPKMAAKLAIAYWKAKVPIEARENVQVAAEAINGGTNGMAARVVAANKWLKIISPQLVADVQQGKSIYHGSKSSADMAGHVHPPLRELSESHGNRTANAPAHASDVVSLQTRLSNLGYQGLTARRLDLDDDLGPNTLHAIKSFQRAHHLHVDGIVGKHTLAALEDAQRWPLLSEATHPQHRLHAQVEQGIRKLPSHGRSSDREIENAAVALTIAAHTSGLRQVDHVVLGSNGVNLFAVQGRMEDPGHRRVHVELAHAVAHAVDHRSMAMSQPPPDHLHAVAFAQQQAQPRAPVMTGP
jgi:putative chitinase